MRDGETGTDAEGLDDEDSVRSNRCGSHFIPCCITQPHSSSLKILNGLHSRRRSCQ